MDTKRCSACREHLPVEEFSPSANQCRVCRRLTSAKYRASNRALCNERSRISESKNQEKYKARHARYRERSPDKVAAKRERYRAKHGERWKQLIRDWAQKNADRKAESCARRYAQKTQATPLWADKEKIAGFYQEAAERTRASGVLHVVDHIVPLRGKTVCGLHVHTNLRVITQTENLKKGNRL